MPTITVTIRVDLEEVPGRGWLARSPELRATATGDTEAEALDNLRSLFERYPEVLQPLFEQGRPQPPKLELVPA